MKLIKTTWAFDEAGRGQAYDSVTFQGTYEECQAYKDNILVPDDLEKAEYNIRSDKYQLR